MANNLFNEMQNMQNNNIMNQFNQFKNNPIQFLTQRKINIPNEYSNNPQQAVQYLLNNGQMSQQALNGMIQMANKMGIKL